MRIDANKRGISGGRATDQPKRERILFHKLKEKLHEMNMPNGFTVLLAQDPTMRRDVHKGHSPLKFVSSVNGTKADFPKKEFNLLGGNDLSKWPYT